MIKFTLTGCVLAFAILSVSGCARDENTTVAIAPTDAATPPTLAATAPAPPPAPTAPPIKMAPVPARPAIISRAAWKAEPALKGMKPQTPRFITVHHTATRQSSKSSIEQKLRNLQNFSQHVGKLDGGKVKPAWPDVPYHYYIAANGKIAEGRDPKFAGDTNTDYNPVGHLLIVLEGNFEVEKPTPAELQSLAKLATWLEAKYKIPASQVKGHNDYAQTACPGKNLKAEIARLRRTKDQGAPTVAPASKASSSKSSPSLLSAPVKTASKPVVQADAELERAIGRIRQQYAKTQARFRSDKRVDTEIAGGEGAVITAYWRGGQVEKITANEFFNPEPSNEYYFKNDRVYFVLTKAISLDDKRSFEKKMADAETNRFYFYHGKLLRWLNEKHESVPPSSPNFKEMQGNQTSRASYYLMLAKSPERTVYP